jgi:hypothetical protein
VPITLAKATRMTVAWLGVLMFASGLLAMRFSLR